MRTFILFLSFFFFSFLGFGQVSLSFECACTLEVQITPNSETLCENSALQIEANIKEAVPEQTYTYEWSFSDDFASMLCLCL